MLKVKNLSLIKTRSILKNICLEAPTGRVTLLLGKSGSGKTSLLRSLVQLESHYEGEIIYQNQCLKNLKPRDRSQVISYVAQSYSLFPHLSVFENCAQPLRVLGIYPGLSAVEKILQSLGMFAYADLRPHQLSGGQQQRIAIARALLLNSSFILLDEPTSALDPMNTEFLVQTLLSLKNSGKGLIISTQDTVFASKLLDLAVFLEEGRIVEKYDGDFSSSIPGKLAHFLHT